MLNHKGLAKENTRQVLSQLCC